MKYKWLTPTLIGIGAILLIFSSGIEPKADGRQTIAFKIAGLILLMIGIYRASRVKPSEENDFEAKVEEEKGVMEPSENRQEDEQDN